MNSSVKTAEWAIYELYLEREHAILTAAAWDRVEIKKTEDGHEFWGLKEALSGARIDRNFGTGETCLVVDGYEPCLGSYHDCVDIGLPFCEVSRDEMRERIAKRAAELREKAQRLKEEHDRARAYFDKLEDALSAVVGVIKSEAHKGREIADGMCLPSELHELACTIVSNRIHDLKWMKA